MIYAGIDPSLTGTGVFTYNTDTKEYRVSTFSTPADDGTLPSKLARIEKMSKVVWAFLVGEGMPTHVAIEAPAYSSNTGKVWDRAGVWWLLVKKLNDNQIPTLEIRPTMRSKYATGKGTSNKDAVLLAVARNYQDFDVTDNNQADALLLCCMIARICNNPIEESITSGRLEAIDTVRKEVKWEK